MTDNFIVHHTEDNPSPVYRDDVGFHRAYGAPAYIGVFATFNEWELSRWSKAAESEGIPLPTWCMARLREGAAHYERVHQHGSTDE